MAGTRLRLFQNDGEARVSRAIMAAFGPPDYHLMNHVTLREGKSTTQIDHILLSRFGIFVIETKGFNGWIFGDAAHAKWTHVYFRQKFQRQNPLLQNFRHVCAVQEVLSFLPRDAIKSLVVLTGDAQFKTERPPGVLYLDELTDHVRGHTTPIMSVERLQFCVGKLETIRLAISGDTDVEHIENLARRFGGPRE